MNRFFVFFLFVERDKLRWRGEEHEIESKRIDVVEEWPKFKMTMMNTLTLDGMHKF